MNRKPIRSFHDLDVYRNAYQAMLEVFRYILPQLPKEEQCDLADQLRRSTKAVPRLIAEGHSKRHQKRGFIKYIDDAMAESNETLVSLTMVRDLYSIEVERCKQLMDIYDKISRQLYRLSIAWSEFSEKRLTQPVGDNR